VRDLLIGQSAFDPADAVSPVRKTHAIAELVLRFHRGALASLAAGQGMGSIDVAGARRAIETIRGVAGTPDGRLDRARAEVTRAAGGGGEAA
jgi:hypothetical protein